MAKQIALPIDQLRPDHAGGLIVTDCNAFIISALSRSESWPGRCAILSGPARSGKGLLAHYFQGLGEGYVIDDADQVEDEALFNAWNRSQQEQRPLLLLSEYLPSDWKVTLPDLQSRLSAALLLQIPEPDDDMIMQLVQKHLFDRGVAPTAEVVTYVMRRIERSYLAIENFAKAANARALAEGRPLGMAVAREILKG